MRKQRPMYQVTFSEIGLNGYDYRRVGRPRGRWAETTISETLRDVADVDYERENVDHLIMTFIIAIERKF